MKANLLPFLAIYLYTQNVAAIIPRCNSSLHDDNSMFTQRGYNKAMNHTCNTNLYEICSKSIVMSYFEMKPFTASVKNSSTLIDVQHEKQYAKLGLLQKIVVMALADCCGSCLNVTMREVKDRKQLISIENKKTSDILLPTFTQGCINQINSTLPLDTIPIIQLSGAMFITKSSISAALFAEEVLTAIIELWPLLGIAILLAFAAGVVVWIIDTWWNKEHFPRRFMTGAFEGFWWAFITMTTVGYGDRVPKSVPAKLLGVVWVLIGITVCSLLTAALTTTISAVAMSQQPSINHGNVGILRDRVFEKSILMRGNAKKKGFDTLGELVDAIQNKFISGMLLDSYTAKTFGNDILIENDLFVASVIQDSEQSYLGVTVYDRDFFLLLQEYIEYNKDHIKDYVYKIFRPLTEVPEVRNTANLIFTTNSGMFTQVLYTCSVILGSSLLIGFCYELYQLQKKRDLKKERSSFQLTIKSLKKEEEAMQNEIEELLDTWNKRLLSKMNSYSVEGMFSRSNTDYANIIIKISPLTKRQTHANQIDILDCDMDNSDIQMTEFKQEKPKAKAKKENHKIRQMEKRRTRHHEVVENDQMDGKYHILDGDSVDMTRNNVNKFANHALVKRKKRVKQKKIPLRTRKKKVTPIDLEEETFEEKMGDDGRESIQMRNGATNYGTHTMASGHIILNGRLPNSRRLPPLCRNEDIV